MGAVTEMTDLIDQLGGPKRLRLTIENFYDKVISDPMLAPVFEEADVTTIRGKQKMFFNMVLGGEDDYHGRDLTKAHAHLVENGIGDPHFSRMKALFRQTMVEMAVDEETIEKIVIVFESHRNDVLGR